MNRHDVIRQATELADRAGKRGVSALDVILALIVTGAVIAAKLRGLTYEQGVENGKKCMEILLGPPGAEREESPDVHRN